MVNQMLFSRNFSLSSFISTERFYSLTAIFLWGVILCCASYSYYEFAAEPIIEPTQVVTTPAAPQAASPTPKVNYSQKLVAVVKRTVNTLRYTSYKFGGSKFDALKGIYVIDCSAYVDNLLKKAFPKAYASLVNATGTTQPNTKNYYDFFKSLTTNDHAYWGKVDRVNELRAGDILVFRAGSTGHIMVVMDKPVKSAEGVLISVSDSAPYAHDQDTRKRSGIGIGKMLLKVDPATGKPAAYAWTKNSSWKRNIRFAMARPQEII